MLFPARMIWFETLVLEQGKQHYLQLWKEVVVIKGMNKGKELGLSLLKCSVFHKSL